MTALLHDVRSDDWPSEDGARDIPVVLLLHGFGSHERDLTGLVPALGIETPWASLRAPLELGNGGAAWFEVTTPGNPGATVVAEATRRVWDWVDAHVPARSRVIPVGFSQGGLMATQLLRTRPGRVLAPVILGGFVAAEPQEGDAALLVDRPAVFWGRGAEDRVITPAAIARTAEFLPRHADIVERVYAGLAHGISATEIGDVRGFLAAHADIGASVPR
jgi:phospholipase/carboxylesterase